MKTMAVIVLMAVVALGCATPRPIVHPSVYSDQELLREYYRVNDEAEELGRSVAAYQARGDWYGQGINMGPAEKARNRRIELRMEMQRRGLKP